jgi:hypothetical protein
MKSGRPKGLKVAVCRCGWRVTGKGKSATCTECKRRIEFVRTRPKKAA